jgi:hypothetical protein
VQPQLISSLEAEELESGGAQSNINSKIVYDCIDPSPYYENSKEPYINENDFVDLGPIEEEKAEPQTQQQPVPSSSSRTGATKAGSS